MARNLDDEWFTLRGSELKAIGEAVFDVAKDLDINPDAEYFGPRFWEIVRGVLERDPDSEVMAR